MVSNLEELLPRQERTTLAENIYEDIKQLLLSGQVAPGQKLTLRGLAEIFGASAMPVRDAISRLVNEGALEMLPNRSVRVFHPTLKEFREAVTLRCCLEGLATAQAVPHIDELTFMKLSNYAQLYEQAGHATIIDTTAIITYNRELHLTLYKYCDMPRLIFMIESMWTQIAPLFALSMNTSKRDIKYWESFEYHRQLLVAIKNKDSEAARAAVIGVIQAAALFIETVSSFHEDE